MSERLAVRSDLGGIIGRVHQVIQVGDPGRSHGGQRNRDLAVIHRGRGQDTTERNPAVARVDMQFVADPGFFISLGVAFGADITGVWQVVEHLDQRHLLLTLQTARLLGPFLALAWATALAFRLGWLLWLRSRLLAPLDRRRIA